MNNHSDIWKNITMIIFFIILIILVFILFIKIKMKIYLEIKGTKTYIKIKFLFFEIKRNGSFKTKKKVHNNLVIRKKINNFILKLFFRHIREFEFDLLEIYQEIGVLEPTITAYSIPLISTITMLPLNLLNINYSNFKYDIIPFYTDLKFNLILKSKITFRLMNIFTGIIAKKLHKLILLNNKK